MYMTELETKLTNIQNKLSALYTESEFRSEGKLYDIERRTTRFYRGVLNAVLMLKLILTDARNEHESFLDLVDRPGCTAVVVTPCVTAKKYKHTLDQFMRHELKDAFKRLIFLSTETENDGLMDQYVGDGRKTTVEFWDRRKLLRQAELISDESRRWLSVHVDDWLQHDEPFFRLSGLPSACDSFIPGSRDKELEELTALLELGNPVFVTGMGGIGKTQTVIQLALRAAPRRGSYLIRYEPPKNSEKDLLRNTILNAKFWGYRFDGQDNAAQDKEYRERMEILRTQYDGAMLVLDNLDCPQKSLSEICSSPTFEELRSMNLQLIITTRSPADNFRKDDFHSVPITQLRREDLLALMKAGIGEEAYSDEELYKLIDFVDGHTLTVYLMARTLSEGWWMDIYPQALLTAMEKCSLSQTEFPEIATDQNQSYEYRQLYSHLQALFDMSGLTEIDRAVMRFATLIPADGMSEHVFQRCLSAEQISSLKELINRGMIQREYRIDRQTAPQMLTLHPVIRTVCFEELKPTGENCNRFLQRMRRYFDPNKSIPKEDIEQIAKCFSYVSDLEDHDGRWAGLAALYWDKHGDGKETLKYNQRALDRSRSQQDIATAYNQLANTYYKLRNTDEAMKYQRKALEYREMISADELQMAHTYNDLGNIYGSQRGYKEALMYHQKALRIAQRYALRNKETVDLAKYYTNVGLSSYKLMDYGQALNNLLRALEIFKSLLPDNHPDIAQAYSSVSMVYDRTGKHEQALEYQWEALRIFEQALPDDHPELARAYNNIGNTLRNLKDYKKALAYQERALEIRKKILAPDSQILAVSYNNIGATYSALRDHNKALENLEKEAQIRERILPKNYLRLVDCYKNMAISYGALNNAEMDQKCREQAVRIMERYSEGDWNQVHETE